MNVGAKFAFEDLVGSQKDEAAQLELVDVRRCQKQAWKTGIFRSLVRHVSPKPKGFFGRKKFAAGLGLVTLNRNRRVPTCLMFVPVCVFHFGA